MTETLNRLGDARWRLLLAEHNEAVRADIERFDGREMKTTGDGFFILFDSPARAVRGAAAISTPPPPMASPLAPGSTPVRSNSKATRCEASQSMPQRAFSTRPSQAKSWSPPLSATCSPAPGSSSSTGESLSYADSTGAAAWRR